MKKKETFTKIDELLTDSSFRNWVLNNEDYDQWQAWALESPMRGKLVEEARLFLLAFGIKDLEITNEEIQKNLANTRNKILVHEIKSKRENVFWKKAWFRSAAVLFVSLSGYFFYQSIYSEGKSPKISYSTMVKDDDEGLIEQTNNSSKPQVVSLSDGSSVLLQPKSKLSYPKEFSNKDRKVLLSGEAFFEIKKDPSKPFLVYANEVVTKVLGTSFRIKAYEENADVEVIVKTGKVNVSENDLLSKNFAVQVDLLPNESIKFNRKMEKFGKIQTLQIKPNFIENSSGFIESLNFEFEDASIIDIFETLEKAYSVEIKYPEKVLKNCYLTTSLSDQPLTEKLNIICGSLGLNTSYELNNNEIIIKSNGCN